MSKIIESSENLPHPPPLTPEQRKLITATVPILKEHGVTITTLFYRQMLEANPDLRNVFSHSKQQRGLQAEALARAVYAYAANIEDLTPILPVVERIAHKHTSVHIVPSQYAIVGKHLLEAITQVVGADVFKGDLYDAWGAAYWNLAHIFINREHELYEAAQWVGWRDFVVARKVQESDEITSFYLKPKDGRPLEPYRPGQYISVQKFVPELGVYQSRQYSLSDAPNPEHFRISVKREPGIRAVAPSGALDSTQAAHPGWLSNLLHATLAEGDPIEVAFPFGEFYLDDSPAPVVLLSAGVGLTPLLAMLNTLVRADSGNEREVSWVQAVRNERVHAFRDHVRRVREAHAGRVRTHVFYSEPGAGVVEGRDFDVRGRLDLGKVPREVLRLDAEDAQYYVCGPEAFMADTIGGLRARGVDASRIHAEVFGSGATPQ
ncbi:bacterial hemoglobin [Trametes versicolor FP-101664 SS1]|uniref:bacterial hemoglobin n=1 Tax=Trametes versicolor (strain FP-101664) TaxID=717944 RepID=UPI0004623E75|nr:bacterial hemoglobin [Trametes versicolor FP-101664 SS1]EIW65107.1 bacterial hemoglobin [Trametes versicolor FP-101664 SS1]